MLSVYQHVLFTLFYINIDSFTNACLQVTSQISIKTTKDSQNSPEISESGDISLRKDSYISENWASFKEPIGRWEYQSFTAEGILEHLNVTKDVSDYLWYITRYESSLSMHFHTD